MRIFIGYGYNDRDQWIEELVFPLVESLGCQVVHGKVMVGEILPSKVKDTLLQCDAILGFLTRREEAGDGRWTTHRWVVEELAAAFNIMPVIEVREEGVDPQSGMLGATQRISYMETVRDRCLVDIAKAISQLRKERSYKTLKLGPTEIVKEMRQLILKPGFQCEYRIRSQTYVSDYKKAEIRREAGGLYMWVEGVNDSDYVEIKTSFGQKSWQSDFEPIDAVSIIMAEIK